MKCSNTESSKRTGWSRFPTLLPFGVATVFLGLSVWPCAAQFPAAAGNDTTFSMGVFRIIVNPDHTNLVAPAVALNGYPGYHSSDQTLTSPVLLESTITIIGRGAPHNRTAPAGVPPYYPYFPAGTGDVIDPLNINPITLFPPFDRIGASSTSYYPDYAPGIPPAWSLAPPPTREVLTEIENFQLATAGSAGDQGCTNPVTPTIPISWTMVKAGTAAGVGARSLGMVQSKQTTGLPANDYPARSFFDVFVQVNLPPVPGTVSGSVFPGTGLVLTNPVPLVITNLDLTTMPPSVVYIHDGDTNGLGVPLYFTTTQIGQWSAGEIFGWLILAGHGTLSNNCASEAALVAATLGTATAPMPAKPVPFLRSSSLFPTPLSSYNSVLTDTNPPGISDVVPFTFTGQGTYYIRDIKLMNLSNSIAPPVTGQSVWSYANATLSFGLSIDGVNFVPAVGTGGVSIIISNQNSGGALNKFSTMINQFNISGNSPFGPFWLKLDTTHASAGMHTYSADPRGYRVSSFFDVFTEFSPDNVNFALGGRSTRLSATPPLPVPGTIWIKRTNNLTATLTWNNTFQLQTAGNVTGPWSDMSGISNGPVSITIGSGTKFFRLRQ